MLATAFYRRLRKRESCNKSLRQKDSDRSPAPKILDPSYELFHNCEQLHGEGPNPECTLCNYDWELTTKLFWHGESPTSSTSQDDPEQSYSPSVYSYTSSSLSSPTSPTSPDGALSRQQSLLPAPSCCIRRSQSLPTTNYSTLPEPIPSSRVRSSHGSTEVQDPHDDVQELEAPPSYAIALATSPRSRRQHIFPERPHMVPRLTAPFSDFDPLDTLPELAGDSPNYDSTPSISPATPASNETAYNTVYSFQAGTQMTGSLTPIPERNFHDHEEGLSYRDDLIKQGLLL